ncbi:MAG: class I SAM-dependent methyltransferase, partial [Candidatus Methanomethylicaceae archaeon]
MHLMRYRYASACSRGACVLDAACGPGYGAAMLATEGKAARVVALDISEAAIAGARRKYKAYTNLEFIRGNVEDLPFADHTFDLYASFETIEHVP